jgi:ActR/RegA family two-component response regulator
MLARPIALALAAVLVAGGLAAPAAAADPPRSRAAAIAIRDHVPGYQKFFSRQFTVPRLADGYADYTYLTEGARDRKHDELLDAVRKANARFEAVDLFLLTNGEPYVRWIAELPAADRSHLRLVYNTGAGGAAQGREWIELGARTYVGHPSDNVAPVFYVYFLPAWLEGRTAEEAMGLANAATHDHLFSEGADHLLELVRLVGNNDGATPEQLWTGTEAKLFGDQSLTNR